MKMKYTITLDADTASWVSNICHRSKMTPEVFLYLIIMRDIFYGRSIQLQRTLEGLLNLKKG